MALAGTLGADSRRRFMLEAIAADGQLLLGDAAAQCDVHPMTIRRDFEYLENAGLARRVRGGLVAIAYDGFPQRRVLNMSAKRRIANKLAELVPRGATIGLDSSTTIFYLASTLPTDMGLAVVSNSLEVFEALHSNPGVRCYLTGGERDERNASLVGQLAINALGTFNLDVCFVSALSLHSAFGTSESTLEQAAVKNAMTRNSQKVILAVDATKLETRSSVRALDLDRADVLVTDLAPEDARLDSYRDTVPEIR